MLLLIVKNIVIEHSSVYCVTITGWYGHVRQL